jgi:hypothetical protein
MDDYNTDLLAEAKNEYTCRLVTILSPLIIQGIKSIFKEAYKLCIENEERNKYLMTFQNFLSRVIKWNTIIINEETERIIKASGCSYLEDLLTCVHITQLKILTSIRVSSKQKKIDIDIPKLTDFVHKVYILFARKLYTNIYLFEKEVTPLTQQKNMRECELLCKESIMEAIRDSMPIEQILRSYIDETTDEEIIEEISRVETDEEVTENTEEEKKEETIEATNSNEESVEKPELKIKKADDSSETVQEPIVKRAIATVVARPVVKNEEESVKLNVSEKIIDEVEKEEPKKLEVKTNVGFNDDDAVMQYDKLKSPSSIKREEAEIISAPKTDERLEQISHERNEQRKLEEAEEDDEDEEERLKIHDSADLKLDTLDIHSLDKGLKIETPLLTDVEVLT